jgi:hypothetical protein
MSIRTIVQVLGSHETAEGTVNLEEISEKARQDRGDIIDAEVKDYIIKYVSYVRGRDIHSIHELFARETQYQDAISLLQMTFAFVHLRVDPMSTVFPGMPYTIMYNARGKCIPAEPITFNFKGADLRVVVDATSICAAMAVDFDTSDHSLSDEEQLAQMFVQTTEDENAFNEKQIKDAIILLMMVEHAYTHYNMYKRFGDKAMITSTWDHTLNRNAFQNESWEKLLLSKFSFSLNTDSLKRTSIPLLKFTQ